MTDVPVTVDWETDARDGVTLVTLVLDNDTPVPQRVQVSNRLDGPVSPPRSAGVPEPGWSREGYEGVVPADGRLALGYACPAPIEGSTPVELGAVGPVDRGSGASPPAGDARAGTASSADRHGLDDLDAAATAALRRVGSGRPPRDAIPTERGSDGSGSENENGAEGENPGGTDGRGDSGPGADEPSPDSPPVLPAATPSPLTDSRTRDDADTEPAAGGDGAADTDDATPVAVDAWLRAVEARVDLAERLTDPSVPAATAALEEAGGLDAAASAVGAAEADAATLRAVATRAEALAARADATDVPIDALRRLA
ncbi:hypothetical protein ACFO0N_16175 [Halobium salinum]|uniref:DUF8080 domain-containing protein n=1 Tax=Halobium salinum TaxID=1364940 RepID=A0ABD5PG98_9EURY|nr:hypothetical protein [Halobium salinum]